jgi:hypothetical protein
MEVGLLAIATELIISLLPKGSPRRTGEVDFRRTRERITLVDGLRHFVALEQFAKTAAETLGGD